MYLVSKLFICGGCTEMKSRFLLVACVNVLFFCAVVFSSTHPCDRECEWPPKRMICNYEFTMEWYYTMSKACYDCPYNTTDCFRPDCVPADGVARPIIAVNRQLPGPAIRVCHNDEVRVVVNNRMDNGEGLAIHWHGLYMREHPYMDGVPMLTQCPIPYGTSFTYTFIADPPGTHWWHSHSGLQRSDGQAGPLVVKRADEREPQRSLYDVDSPDHTVFIMDWLHQPTLTKFLAHHHSTGNNKGEGMLINGKGVFKEFTSNENDTFTTAYEIFTVTQKRSYRFRVISNAAVYCPMKLTVDGHLLHVIASDGADIEKYTVTSLVVHGGERFDFVLNATEDISNYWVKVQGLADCRNQSQRAILRYEGAPSTEPPSMELTKVPQIQLNPWNQKQGDNYTQVSSLKRVYSQDSPGSSIYKGEPNQTHFIGFDFNRVDNVFFHHPEFYPLSSVSSSNRLFTPQLNNVSFQFPEYPLLTQSEYINDTTDLCDPDSDGWNDQKSRFCDGDFCSCPYVIDIVLGSLVELIIYDEGRKFDSSHPMHLHGQHFAVMAMDKLGTSVSTEEMKELHSNGSISRNFDGPLKDTVIIPDGGYAVVRFVADNPGVWFFHCHLIFHSQIGMELAFRVGNRQDWVKPPDGFPKCGSWPASLHDKSGNTQVTPWLKLMFVLSVASMYLQ